MDKITWSLPSLTELELATDMAPPGPAVSAPNLTSIKGDIASYSWLMPCQHLTSVNVGISDEISEADWAALRQGLRDGIWPAVTNLRLNGDSFGLP